MPLLANDELFLLMMKNSFYNGPKLEIREHYIKIKKRNIKLSYSDIKSVNIKNTHTGKAWILFIITGIIVILAFICILFLTIQGLLTGSSFITSKGHHNNYKSLAFIIAFLVGVPLFIASKITKYFRKHPMLIITWEQGDFRIKISELGIKESEVKRFFEGKVKVIDFEKQKV